MFKKVITYKGFWKGVWYVALLFIAIWIPIQWAFNGFSTDFFKFEHPFRYVLQLLVGGFIYGFAVTYGKFWGKLKQEEYKK